MNTNRILSIVSIWMMACMVCLADEPQQASATIDSILGRGFGQILIVKGIPEKVDPPRKGTQRIRFMVSAVNGETLETPISVPLQMLNEAAAFDRNG